MGMGIAQVAAQNAKISVIVMDVSKDQLSKQMAFLGCWEEYLKNEAHAYESY